MILFGTNCLAPPKRRPAPRHIKVASQLSTFLFDLLVDELFLSTLSRVVPASLFRVFDRQSGGLAMQQSSGRRKKRGSRWEPVRTPNSCVLFFEPVSTSASAYT